MAAVPESDWSLFERFGVELEYMIVQRETLAVAPIADRLLAPDGGEPDAEIEVDGTAWSNELVLHVLELKTPAGPAASLHGLADVFQCGIAEANARLRPHDALLLPSGMHPTMDPLRDARLWPHEYGTVYRAFDRIFDCRGHGWSNLQSAHLNLPFHGDDEFARLHAAVRFALPLLPALAAASPIVEGRLMPWLDARMAFYRENAHRVPSVSGLVVPEPVRSEAEYRDRILAPIYADLAPLDPEGTLRHEWVNARGAIARFERGAIEVRVLDTQECPLADLAILAATSRIVRALCEESTAPIRALDAFATERLAALLAATIADADGAVITDIEYLALLGISGDVPLPAAEAWIRLLDAFPLEDGKDAARWRVALDVILTEGCLARRIVRRLGSGVPTGVAVHSVYAELAHCLADGRQLLDVGAHDKARPL